MYGKKLFIEEEAVRAAKNQDGNSSAASRNGALRVATYERRCNLVSTIGNEYHRIFLPGCE